MIDEKESNDPLEQVVERLDIGRIFQSFSNNLEEERPEKQRRRWHMGLIQSIMLHRDVVFNPGYGEISPGRNMRDSKRPLMQIKEINRLQAA